jgi:hypothetical protein
MTALEQVKRIQRVLAMTAIASALLWGFAAALLLYAAAAFVEAAPDASSAGSWNRVVASAGGVIIAACLLWRSRHIVSAGRVALWIEERVPALQYALVTAMESTPSQWTLGMQDIVGRHDIRGLARPTARHRLLTATAAVAITGSVAIASTSQALRGAGLRSAGAVDIDGLPAGSRLNPITARVTAPSYARRATVTMSDPLSISALAGSRIVIEGNGPQAGITASIGSESQSAAAADDGWNLAVTMPRAPAPLILRDRRYDRIIVLNPIADNPPTVTLRSPLRDTTLRSPHLNIILSAAAADDIGLAAGYFEYLISTGSGESFSARTINTRPTDLQGSRTGSLSASLNLAEMNLKEGDVVSIRAIVRDINTMSGPGLGTSDTRTFRIARASEYDSMTIDAAAPLPIDSSAMSQQMLILMTERLVSERKRLPRASLVARSRELGDLEDAMRKKLYVVLFEGEDLFGQEKPGDPPLSIEELEPPDTVTEAKDPDLRIAYNALWQAVGLLKIGEPHSALPPMRTALRALDRVRLANRSYPRGLPPKVVVDLARVRMTGKETGSANLRTPRTRADSARVELIRGYSEAVDLLGAEPAVVMRALTLLQVSALRISPPAAAALGEAVAALRAGQDATLPLLRARRALAGAPESRSGLPVWSPVW